MTKTNLMTRPRQRAPKDDPDATPDPSRRKRQRGYQEAEDEGAPPPRPALDYDPAAAIGKRERLAVPGKRYFKLAAHQRTMEAHAFGRFGAACESEYGFKVLRDPRTGWPVVRDHGDLKPGEVSLVLE
jgi:hypothetical protein